MMSASDTILSKQSRIAKVAPWTLARLKVVKAW